MISESPISDVPIADGQQDGGTVVVIRVQAVYGTIYVQAEAEA